MPAITIKDYQWRQTENKIIIYVLLKGRPKSVDLLAMDNYVKISFPPFILELFLWGNVLEEESECTLADTKVIFSLQKANIADWPSLEMEGISKEEKRDLRNRILEKVQNVLENRAKSKNENRKLLQREAVKVQINLDTNTLNKVESLRNSSRKAAMQDFEEWRSKAEEPILQNISGKVQKNKKEYRSLLKWFKDELGILKPDEIDTKESNKNVEIEEKRLDKSVVLKKLREEPSEKNRKRELIVKENIKKGSNSEKNLNEDSLIEEKLKTEPLVKKTSKTELIDKVNLKEDAVFNKNTQEKAGCLNIKEITTLNERFNPEEISSDSESNCSLDCYRTSHKSSKPLVKEMDKKSLRNFYAKMKKERRPDHDLIDRILRDRYSNMYKIFDKAGNLVPLPRRNGIINITFSERAFPTPARESSYIEEQEWLAKQAEARRETGFVVEDLRPEEQDPQWLKDKGDDFFKDGNYAAAISAYSYGIKISEKMAALYLNRSAAHYAIGNYYRCIDDCSKVLELMEPKCESNRVSRARCHACRGAALCKLSAPQHGIPELEAAVKLDPNNESIKSDLEAAKQYFNIKE